MRFNVQPRPREFDVRVRKVFALLPRRIGNTVVWLERYELKEIFAKRVVYSGYGLRGIEWRWEPVARKLIND